MNYENNELKYTECDICGHEKKCVVQHESGEDHAVCPDCLATVDID